MMTPWLVVIGAERGLPGFSLVLNAVLPYDQEDSAWLAWAMLQTLLGSPAHAE